MLCKTNGINRLSTIEIVDNRLISLEAFLWEGEREPVLVGIELSDWSRSRPPVESDDTFGGIRGRGFIRECGAQLSFAAVSGRDFTDKHNLEETIVEVLKCFGCGFVVGVI